MPSLGDRLAVILGLWTVCTVTPPVAYLLDGPFAGTVTAVDAAVVAGLFVIGTGSARLGLRRMTAPAEQLREGTELAGPMLLASGVMLVSLPVSVVDGIIPAVPFAVGGTLGFLAAFLTGYTADQAVIRQIRAASDHRLIWSATKRPEATWLRAMRVVGAVAAFGVATLAGNAGGLLLSAFWALVGLLQFGLLVQNSRRRRYELTDAGLITAFGLLRWENFDGYELTDNALRLYGNVWPFGTIAYDRDSVDDLDAVQEALGRLLPRQQGQQNPSVLDSLRQKLSS